MHVGYCKNMWDHAPCGRKYVCGEELARNVQIGFPAVKM
jgi:hypothetical protein